MSLSYRSIQLVDKEGMIDYHYVAPLMINDSGWRSSIIVYVTGEEVDILYPLLEVRTTTCEAVLAV